MALSGGTQRRRTGWNRAAALGTDGVQGRRECEAGEWGGDEKITEFRCRWWWNFGMPRTAPVPVLGTPGVPKTGPPGVPKIGPRMVFLQISVLSRGREGKVEEGSRARQAAPFWDRVWRPPVQPPAASPSQTRVTPCPHLARSTTATLSAPLAAPPTLALAPHVPQAFPHHSSHPTWLPTGHLPALSHSMGLFLNAHGRLPPYYLTHTSLPVPSFPIISPSRRAPRPPCGRNFANAPTPPLTLRRHSSARLRRRRLSRRESTNRTRIALQHT